MQYSGGCKISAAEILAASWRLGCGSNAFLPIELCLCRTVDGSFCEKIVSITVFNMFSHHLNQKVATKQY